MEEARITCALTFARGRYDSSDLLWMCSVDHLNHALCVLFLNFQYFDMNLTNIYLKTVCCKRLYIDKE